MSQNMSRVHNPSYGPQFYEAMQRIIQFHMCTSAFHTHTHTHVQEGQLSYEEAIIAKQNHTRETRERVGLIKEQMEEMMKTYFSQRAEEQKELRQLVEDTMAGHKSTREARTKLQNMKQKIGECMAFYACAWLLLVETQT